MADCIEGEIPPKKAEFFHSFPHVNFNFDNISTTFKPTDKDYQQDLLLFSFVPVAIGAILFIIFTVYFLTSCCSWCCCRKPKHKTKTKHAACLAVCIWICVLICCGSIISGFVFNDGIHNGVVTVTKAFQNVTSTFNDVHDEVASVQNDILDIEENIVRMINLPGIPEPVKDYLRGIMSSIMDIIQELNRIKKHNIPDIASDVKTGEYYRWWATFGVLGLGILTCLCAVYSTIRHSKCGFFLALLFGCFAFLLDCVIIGPHLGAAIGMSDLCIDPRKTVDFYLRTSSLVTKEVINYYFNCTPGSINPYEKYVDSSLDLILTANEFLKKITDQAWLPQKDINQLTTDLYNTESSLIQIRNNLKCANIKQEYHKAHCAVCFPVVGGLSWLLLVSFMMVTFLVPMLFLVVPLCKRIHHKKRRRHFMNSMLNGVESSETQYHSVTSDEESVPLMPSCPPPPYESTERNAEYQFHSCQEDRNHVNSTAQQQQIYIPNDLLPPLPQEDGPYNAQNNFAPPPLRGQVVPIERKITMAF